MPLRDALTISHYGARNTYNRVSSTPLVWLAVAGLQLLVIGMGLSPGSEGGALGLGRLLAAGETAAFADRLTATVSSFFVLLTVFAAVGWTSGNAEAEPYVDGFLSMTSARAVALGDAGRTAAVLFGGVMPVAVTLAVTACVVGGRPTAAVPLLLALVALFLTTQAVGAVLGMGVQYAVVSAGVSERADSAVGLVVAGVSGMSFGYPTAIGETVAATPVGAVTRLPALAVAPGTAPGGAALLAVGTLLVVNALCVVAVGRFAPTFYLEQPTPESTDATPDPADREYDGDDSPLRGVADRLLGRRQAVLTTVLWRRAIRSSELPQRVGMYVMLGLAAAASAVTNTAGFPFAPVILVVFGCTVTGAAITTNALADEGHRMALWGTTAVRPRDLYVSKTAAMAVPCVAVFGAAAVTTAWYVSGYTPLSTAVVAVLAVVGITASAWIGTGLGCLWIAGVTGDADADVTTPSLLVSACHTALAVLLVSPGLSVVVQVENGGVEEPLLAAGTLAGTLVSLVGTCVLFYLAATRRMSERNYESLV